MQPVMFIRFEVRYCSWLNTTEVLRSLRHNAKLQKWKCGSNKRIKTFVTQFFTMWKIMVALQLTYYTNGSNIHFVWIIINKTWFKIIIFHNRRIPRIEFRSGQWDCQMVRAHAHANHDGQIFVEVNYYSSMLRRSHKLIGARMRAC